VDSIVHGNRATEGTDCMVMLIDKTRGYRGGVEFADLREVRAFQEPASAHR
jgi:hypothetical protein